MPVITRLSDAEIAQLTKTRKPNNSGKLAAKQAQFNDLFNQLEVNQVVRLDLEDGEVQNNIRLGLVAAANRAKAGIKVVKPRGNTRMLYVTRLEAMPAKSNRGRKASGVAKPAKAASSGKRGRPKKTTA